MEGYDVLTFDDEQAGTVVGKQGSNLVVEQGAIFKHRRALPEIFVTVDEGEQVVRTTVSKDVLEDRLRRSGTSEVDEQPCRSTTAWPPASRRRGRSGDGDLNPDDPAWTAETQEQRTGVEPATRSGRGSSRSRSEARGRSTTRIAGLLGDRNLHGR